MAIKKTNPNPTKLPTPENPAPAVDKAPRKPRPLFDKDFGAYRITERKAVFAAPNGATYRVSEFVVTFKDNAGNLDPNDARNGVASCLRDALKLAHSYSAKNRGRVADPNGTIALIRAARAISAVIAKRTPDLTAALSAAVDSINADLHWQMESGIDVDAIRAAEDKRIAAVKDARAKAKADNK